jgi:hypothetical protein
MTTLGKIFVLLIVVLSVLCLMYGLGVYTYSIDWGWSANYTRESLGEKVLSEIDKHKNTIRQLDEAQGQALAGLYRARADLAKAESPVAARQLMYAQELERIQSGKDITREELRKQKPWLFEKNPRTGRPYFDDDSKESKSYYGYVTDLKAVLARITAVRKDIDKLLADQKRLTEELIGKEDNAGKRQPGLYALVTREQEVQKRAREELRDLKPLYYQELIAGQVLRNRQDSLRSRLQELESLKTTKK